MKRKVKNSKHEKVKVDTKNLSKDGSRVLKRKKNPAKRIGKGVGLFSISHPVTKKAKALKVAKVKTKKYAVKGHIVLNGDGKVVSSSKGIVKVARGRKGKTNQYMVSFLVTAKDK